MTGKKISTFRVRFSELVDSSTKSQSVIAGDLGVAKQTISAWITGQSSPRTPMVNVIADYFEVTPGWLLGFDCTKNADKKTEEKWNSYVNENLVKTQDERTVLSAYRSLSPHGKTLLLERCEELKLLYGKKSESDSAESV